MNGMTWHDAKSPFPFNSSSSGFVGRRTTKVSSSIVAILPSSNGKEQLKRLPYCFHKTIKEFAMGITEEKSSTNLVKILKASVLRKKEAEHESSIKYSGDLKALGIIDLLVKRIDQGAMSEVYCIDIAFSNRSKTTSRQESHPSKWIVKLCRPGLNLQWMFRREAIFYTQYGPKLMKSESLPFRIAKPLSTTENHIIIEYIPDCTCYRLMEDGCPKDKISYLIQSMASLHAAGWESRPLSGDDDFSPGIGQRLSPLNKEQMFVKNWKNCLSRMDFQQDESSLRDFAYMMCQKMERLRLRDIHEIVHGKRVTCIHGDFHIANWLFPKNSAGDNDSGKPILIDWATWGYGNPGVDLAFFLVVSTNSNVVSNVDPWLQEYHSSLLDRLSLPNHFIIPSLNQIREWFQWALLLQWIVLVSYDEMCYQMTLATEQDPIKRQIQLNHFRNVNYRTLLCLQGFGDFNDLSKKLPIATLEEQLEAENFAKTAPLEI